MQRFIAEGKKIDPDFDLQVIYPPSGYKDTYAVRWAYPWLGSAVLPASLEEDPQHLEEVLKYINWCYSDEAEELLTFGKEGETFKVEDGVRKYIAPNIQAKYGVGHQSITFRQNMDYYTGAFDKDQRDLLSKISKECVKPGPPPSPLNADQLEQVQVYITTLRDYCTTMLEKFVSGAEPLSKWDDYVAQCKAKGCDKLVETYNNALKNKK